MRKLKILGIPPSLNQLRRMHYQEQARQKRKWGGVVAMEVARQLGKPKPYKRAKCIYTFYFPTRIRHDPTNYSPKWIEDGLVAANVIEDDSFDHVEVHLRKGGVDKKNPRVEIEIIPIESEGETNE